MKRRHIIKKSFNLLFILLAIIISLSLTSAQGCCFDSATGFCSMNSESTNCLELGGEFYSDAKCNINKCQKGCCTLGNSAQFVTARTCELLARSYGYIFTDIFQYTTEAACLQSADIKEKGACILGGEYEKECKYVTKEECYTDYFYKNIFCTDKSLNTVCKKTSKTFCYDEDVYYLDSCNNPSGKKEDCDYEKGTICRTKSSNEAYCKSLNCGVVDDLNRNNGDEWCIGLNGLPINSLEFGTSSITGDAIGITGYQTYDECAIDCEYDWYSDYTTCLKNCASKYGSSGSSGASFSLGHFEQLPAPVGSRFFKKYCLNGEVFTEPCNDFRTEYCEDTLLENGNVKCEINPWNECLSANSETSDLKPGESRIKKEECDESFCTAFEANDCTYVIGRTEGKGSNTDPWCGENRHDFELEGIDKSRISETPSELMQDLHLEMCLPKIPGGLEFYPKKGEVGTASSATSTCALGNYEKEVILLHSGAWFATEGAGIVMSEYTLTKMIQGKKGFHNPSTAVQAQGVWEGAGGSLKVNTAVLGILNARCSAIGDCDGKANWKGVEGGETSGEEELYFTKESGSSPEKISATFSFECLPWQAPSESDICGECGKDGLPCSEYRCKALGKNCEYSEPTGADTGFCVESNDKNPAIITLKSINPQSPIPPFSDVEITINTNEFAYCKFNLGDSGELYEDMSYDFGKNWSTEHKVILTLPGKIPFLSQEEEINEYELITKDGKYEMFVKCIDTAGNWNINAHLINFRVMEDPDSIAPIINLESFIPYSGSSIKYNTNSKEINFKINEPAECKWDTEDVAFINMDNSFNCDKKVSDKGVINGYSCKGIITDVSNDTKETSKYYIRCKDQPWLEGKEDSLYKRNVNEKSYEYSLRASDELEILETTPIGKIIKSYKDSSINIKAITTGGGYNGRAVCKWKLEKTEGENPFSTVYLEFSQTGDRTHQHLTSNLSEGDYKLYVKCEDNALNIANSTTEFELEIDAKSPDITRAYHKDGHLVVITDENAECAYSFDKDVKCNYEFDYENATLMQGSSKEHITDWEYDKEYYVRCKDFRDNSNKGCGVIIRTY